MSPVIRVTDTTYMRLEAHAKGFDNPNNVINRLLDYYEETHQGKNVPKDAAVPKNYITKGTPHKWTQDDDIVAFYLYRYGNDDLGSSIDDISEYLDITPRSMRMRIQNFQYLDGKGGLSGYAKLSERIYLEYKSVPHAEHRERVKKILN